jgi:N-acetylmuramoyl-L-alanine amidase CwlA
MRGLRQYIRKHGRHFTEELAMTVTNGRWDSSEIMEKAESMVYYNVTGSTVGDIVFLTNYAKDTGKSFYKTKYNCVKFALCIVGEYALRDGAMFRKWTEDNRDFDLTEYI